MPERRYIQHISPKTIRRVWAALSANPQRSKAELMAELGLARSTFYTALWRLQEAGYIDNPESGAWRVLVPFRIITKPKAGALSSARDTTPVRR
jgi:Winged helix-turn-helix DNA-binding